MDEVMRMYHATGTLSRRLTRDYNLCGYDLPKGTNVMTFPAALGYNNAVWKDPEVFDPERFSEAARKEERDPFASVPFSAGNRNCIGQKFAVQEFVILLCTLVRYFEFHVEGTYNKDVIHAISPLPVALKIRFVSRQR
eukprot:TRINITY_DN11505_c0_g1_i1.p1 TRINITY_DN11505_c0_g1~~TRINITY_DN11505_c0_g1_i1.p1  ORF type:complete len:138 (-),score=21.26 TRINITY_DN11505_c0_g1_i1:213-626(-)